MMETTDERYMKRALELAEKGRLTVSPNPMVGAVLVNDGCIIGEGYHRLFGLPHAEVEAISDAAVRGESTAGATLYVTLEPCCHQGKTPPCTEAVITAGITEVVSAVLDPNPVVNGKGLKELGKNGISCRSGLYDGVSRRLNEKYFTWITSGRPFVMVKIAATLDGKVSSGRGVKTFITGEESLHYVHRLRSEYEAIMVGAGTVKTDDPRLTCRLDENSRHPVRIVVSTRGYISPGHKIFDSADGVRRILLAGTLMDEASALFEERGVEVIQVGLKEGRVDLDRGFQELGRQGISSVLVEAGPTLAGTLFREKLAHRACFCLAPMVLGSGTALPAVDGVSFGLPDSPDVPCLDDIIIRQLGRDVAIEGRVVSEAVKAESSDR